MLFHLDFYVCGTKVWGSLIPHTVMYGDKRRLSEDMALKSPKWFSPDVDKNVAAIYVYLAKGLAHKRRDNFAGLC